MKINTPEIYDPSHLPDDLQEEIAKLATTATRQAGVDDVCKDDPIERGLVNAHILNTIGQNVSEPENDATEVDGQGDNTEKREFSPESPEAKELLGKLENRFSANMHLHEGVNWNDVKTSLEKSPESLWSLAQMESAGHEPDVYHDDESDYYFGTCSKESPESARNCVYNKKAVDWLKENDPNEKFNGSAVEMAQSMGIELMLPDYYKDILQEKGRFDEETLSWLLTRSGLRSIGLALVGYRLVAVVDVIQCGADRHDGSRAWRGSLRVKKITA